jgi:hypothetical protein
MLNVHIAGLVTVGNSTDHIRPLILIGCEADQGISFRRHPQARMRDEANRSRD